LPVDLQYELTIPLSIFLEWNLRILNSSQTNTRTPPNRKTNTFKGDPTVFVWYRSLKAWYFYLFTIPNCSTTWKTALLITLLCLKFQASTSYPKRVNLIFYGAFSRVLAVSNVNTREPTFFASNKIDISSLFLPTPYKRYAPFALLLGKTRFKLFIRFTRWTRKFPKPYAPYARSARCKPRINHSAKDY